MLKTNQTKLKNLTYIELVLLKLTQLAQSLISKG